MDVKNIKRKTRPQKKARIVAIVASALTALFSVGVIISAINYPDAHSVDDLYEDDSLESIRKLDNNAYLVTSTVKDEEGTLKDAHIYHYDSDDKLLDKVSVFSDAKKEFGIDGLVSFDGCYVISENDSIYAVSSNYLFHYEGLKENNLTLQGYCNNFKGRIVSVAANDTDLYVITQNASQYRIDRFLVGDESYSIQSSGYVYEINNRNNNYNLVCSKNMFIYSVNVIDDYLYITTNTYIRRIHRDMLNNNYRILFENELASVKSLNPLITDEKEQKQMAKQNCLLNYGWEDYDYDVHTVLLSKDKVSANNFAFYLLPEMVGLTLYKDRFYYADKADQFFYYTVEELNDSPMVINYLEDELHLIENITFPVALRAEVSVNAICYYETGDVCVVFHEDSSSKISLINLQNAELVHTVDVSTRIHDAFYNENNGTLRYKYQDPINKESGVNYLSVCSVSKMLTIDVVKAILLVFSILTGISLIVSIISWLSFAFKNVMTSVIKTGKGVKKNWPIYVIIFPTILLLCAFCYYPGVAAIYTSFFDYQPGINNIKTWNHFGNYLQIFSNLDSLRHFGNMILFLLADVVLAIVPPLIFAYFLTLMRSKKVSGVLRTLLFIPGIIPGIASLLIWRTGIYGDYGLVNGIIKASGGTPILFFQIDDYTNMLWLIMMGFPFVGSYLIFYGAMMNIPSSYYEAAELDGISVWKRFVKIDIPLCIPQMKYVLVMTIIASIQNFSRVYIVMGRTQNVVSAPIVEMYMLMNGSERNYGLASAYATVLFVILFGLTFLSMRERMKEK